MVLGRKASGKRLFRRSAGPTEAWTTWPLNRRDSRRRRIRRSAPAPGRNSPGTGAALRRSTGSRKDPRDETPPPHSRNAASRPASASPGGRSGLRRGTRLARGRVEGRYRGAAGRGGATPQTGGMAAAPDDAMAKDASKAGTPMPMGETPTSRPRPRTRPRRARAARRRRRRRWAPRAATRAASRPRSTRPARRWRPGTRRRAWRRWRRPRRCRRGLAAGGWRAGADTRPFGYMGRTEERRWTTTPSTCRCGST